MGGAFTDRGGGADYLENEEMSHAMSDFIKRFPANPPTDSIARRDYWIERGKQAELWGHSFLDKAAEIGNLLVDPTGVLIQKLPLSRKIESKIDDSIATGIGNLKGAGGALLDPFKELGSGVLKWSLIVVGVALISFLAVKFLVKKVERLA